MNSASQSKPTRMSEDTKAMITVLLSIFAFPIGLILMWFWVKWPVWVKVVISIPLLILPIIAIVGIFSAAVLSTVNPRAQIQKAECARQCETSSNKTLCAQTCLENLTPSPVQAQ